MGPLRNPDRVSSAFATLLFLPHQLPPEIRSSTADPRPFVRPPRLRQFLITASVDDRLRQLDLRGSQPFEVGKPLLLLGIVDCQGAERLLVLRHSLFAGAVVPKIGIVARQCEIAGAGFNRSHTEGEVLKRLDDLAAVTYQRSLSMAATLLRYDSPAARSRIAIADANAISTLRFDVNWIFTLLHRCVRPRLVGVAIVTTQ